MIPKYLNALNELTTGYAAIPINTERPMMCTYKPLLGFKFP